MGGLLRAVTTRAEAGFYSLLPASAAITDWRRTRVEPVVADVTRSNAADATRSIPTPTKVSGQVFGEPCELGEGPLWDARRACLHWLDIRRQRLHVFRPQTGEMCSHRLPVVAGAVALCADGRLLLATSHGLAFYDPDDADLEIVPATAPGTADRRYNDGKCDARGRFWSGTMRLRGERGREALWRYEPRGGLVCMDRDYTVCNGLGWSVDGRTFYLTDTDTRCIHAYDVDVESGDIANRRVFVDASSAAGRPDGLSVDADDGVWVALSGGWELRRYDTRGRLERTLRLPVPQPTSCAFGGPDLRTLYVTTSRLGLSRRDLVAAPWSGRTFALDVGIAGSGEATFAN